MTTSAEVRPGNKVLHNASGAVVTVIHVNNNVIELDCFPNNIPMHSNRYFGHRTYKGHIAKVAFFK